MSLYIQGCFFTESKPASRSLDEIIGCLPLPRGLELKDLLEDDILEIDQLLENKGIVPEQVLYFSVVEPNGGPDATSLWLEAYESRKNSDGNGSSTLERWFTSLGELANTEVGVAIAAFDGSIDGVSLYPFRDGIAHLVSCLSSPWSDLDNELCVLLSA